MQTKELPWSRIEVTDWDKVYQVDTLWQKDPVQYAINKVKNEQLRNSKT
jgi:hypothetical protein